MGLTRLIPSGSSGKPARSAGKCIVCGGEYKRPQLIVRALEWDFEQEQEAGHKVCVHCSPHVADQTVVRYTMDIDDWSWRWLQHLDDGVL